MLDINEFRVEKGGDPERIRKSQKLRYASVDIVDEVIELDKQWRECTVTQSRGCEWMARMSLANKFEATFLRNVPSR